MMRRTFILLIIMVFAISAVAQPEFTVSPDHYDYGTVGFNEAANHDNFTFLVTNNGSTSGQITDLYSLGFEYFGNVDLMFNCGVPYDLDPGETVRLTCMIELEDIGVMDAAIVFEHSTDVNGATSKSIPFTGNILSNILRYPEGPLNFGDLEGTNPQGHLTFEIENLCEIVHTIYELEIDPNHRNEIETDQGLPFTIQPGEIITVGLTWIPQSEGDLHSWLAIVSSEEMGEPYMLDLIGSYALDVNNESNHYPEDYSLLNIYPNPFNASTTINFHLKEAGDINLAIYNIHGQLVKTIAEGTVEAGNHQTLFNAPDLASGIYYCVLKTSEQTLTKKMVYIR